MDFHTNKKKNIILISLLLLAVIIISSLLLESRDQKQDNTPGSCLILPEEWCDKGTYVELTAPWVAFDLEPGTPVFVPKNGVVSFTILPIVGDEAELEVVTINVGGMDDQNEESFWIVFASGPDLLRGRFDVEQGELIGNVSNTPVAANYNLLIGIMDTGTTWENALEEFRRYFKNGLS